MKSLGSDGSRCAERLASKRPPAAKAGARSARAAAGQRECGHKHRHYKRLRMELNGNLGRDVAGRRNATSSCRLNWLRGRDFPAIKRAWARRSRQCEVAECRGERRCRGDPRTSLPRRPDPRRPGATAQTCRPSQSRTRRPARSHRRAACPRTRAAEGGRVLSGRRATTRVDVHTAHADGGAELAALRETAVAEATELRALKLERLNAMTSGLWSGIQDGSVSAHRVCASRRDHISESVGRTWPRNRRGVHGVVPFLFEPSIPAARLA